MTAQSEPAQKPRTAAAAGRIISPGIGTRNRFSPVLEDTTQDNLVILTRLVNGQLKPDAKNLATLKSGDLAVTRGVIQALKDDPDNAALIRRLAGELAMSETISVALGMRRMLMAGQAEPHVADQKIALEESDRRPAFRPRSAGTEKRNGDPQNHQQQHPADGTFPSG